MGRELNRHYCKDDRLMVNKYMKGCSTSTNHQRHASWNHNEISTHSCENGFFQKYKTQQSVGEDVEEREPLCPVGGNVNCCSHCREQYGGSHKIKNRTTIWSSDSTSGYLSEENKNNNLKRYVHHCNILYSSQDTETT